MNPLLQRKWLYWLLAALAVQISLGIALPGLSIGLDRKSVV